MLKHPRRFAAALLACAGLALAEDKPPADPFAKWEGEISKIEAGQKAAPEAGGVLFAGSSSIRLWKLGESFPGLKARNAGFGGSTIPECTHFAARIIFPLKPATVVFYAGDNDIAAGHAPERVAADFAAFRELFRKNLPETKLLFLGIKPSSSRWKLWPQAQEANRLVKTACEADPKCQFVDLSGALLGPDGKPRDELFRDDKLHLNDAGYAEWTKLLLPLLK